ncbi:MAG TPA: hypothetical protein VHU61_08525 [Solirubrobacteraceae bacterium]|jgi:hypothetical protein|nr:hypothetical protein [Solirubrobacteraceae bacterium]
MGAELTASTWFTALPAGWPDAPKIETLRSEFGASGPLAFICMLAASVDQFYGTTKAERRPGTFVLGWHRLAHWAVCDLTTARRIVARCAELEEIHLEPTSDVSFTATFHDWLKWHPGAVDPEAAERQRRYRARLAERATQGASEQH